MMPLMATAAIYGIVAALVFRVFTKPAELRVTANQMIARIMEFALFVDEPRTVLRAQLALVRENLRLLKQVAIPCLIMAALFAFLYQPMTRRYANPNPDILTLPLGSNLPQGVIAESPPVHVLRTKEVTWRIQPTPTHPHWLLWFLAISSTSALLPLNPKA